MLEDTAHGFKTQFTESKKIIGPLFDATERITGNDGVILLDNLHGRTGPMLEEASQTGQGVPRGTQAMQRTGTEVVPGSPEQAIAAGQAVYGPAVMQQLTLQDLDQLFRTPNFLKGLNAEQRQLVETYLKGGFQDVAVPFWLARRLESGLREVAYEGTRPIGTLSQGRARQLYWALQQDMKRFYTETPEGMQIDPMLREAKAKYVDFVTLFNKSIVRYMLDDTPGVKETFLRSFVKRPTAELVSIRASASPENWQRIVGGVVDDLMEKAMGGTERFDPARLQAVDKALQREGKIDVLLTPQQKALWNGIAQDASALTKSPESKMAKALAGKPPGQVASYAFQPGELD